MTNILFLKFYLLHTHTKQTVPNNNKKVDATNNRI